MKLLKPILLLLLITSTTAFCGQYSAIDLRKTFSDASGESPNHTDLIILDCNDHGECVGTWYKRLGRYYKLFVLPTDENVGTFKFISIDGATLHYESLKINNLSQIIGFCKQGKRVRIFTWDQNDSPHLLASIPGKNQKILAWNDLGQAILSYSEDTTTHFALWDRDRLIVLDQYCFDEIITLTNTFRIVGNRGEHAQIVDFSTEEPTIIVPNKQNQNCAVGATDHNEVLLGFEVDDEDAGKICPHSQWLYLWNNGLPNERLYPQPVLSVGFNNHHELIGYKERESEKTAVICAEGKIQSLDKITQLLIDEVITINQCNDILVRAVSNDNKPIYYFLKRSE